MPGRYNMKIWRGNDFDVSFSMADSAGDPTDLTGATAVFRSEWQGGNVTYSSADSEASYIAISDEPGGVVDLHLEPAATRAFPPDSQVDYEIEIRSGGAETTVLFGKIATAGGVNTDA